MRRFRYRIRSFPLALGAILAVTAIPLGFRHPALKFAYLKWNWDDFTQNALLYIPFGLLFPGRLHMALLAALGVSTISEVAQFIAPSRYPGLLDVASNVCGAAVGSLLAIAWRRYGLDLRFLQVRSWTGWAAALLAAFFFMELAPSESPGDLSNWDSACQIALGDEVSGNRRWQGEILEAQLLTAPVPSALIDILAKEGPGSLAKHKSDLPMPPAFDANGRVDVREDSQFMPPRVSKDLFYQGIRRNQLSVLLWVRTADPRQQRSTILSYSCVRFNNFRISQEGGNIVLQLRTPRLAAYEGGQELEASAPLESNRDTLIAALYDGRHAQIYIDGRMVAEDDFGKPSIPFSVNALGLAYGAGAALSLAWVLLTPAPWRQMTLIAMAAVIGVLLILHFHQAIYPGLSPFILIALALGLGAGNVAIQRIHRNYLGY